MARHIHKGRPQRANTSSSLTPRKRAVVIKSPEPTLDILVTSNKRKTTAPPPHLPPSKKRVRFIYPNASSSRQASPPPPSSRPPQDTDDFNAAFRILAILRDAFAAADAEVRRQMAGGADAPSLIGLDDLRRLLRNTEADTKGKGKGKAKER